MSAKPRTPKQAGHYAYGILNPWGDFWSPLTYRTPEDAEAAVRAFFKGMDTSVSRFTYPAVNVRLTVRKAPVKS